MTTRPQPDGETAARQAVMALCADARRDALEAALAALDAPAAEDPVSYTHLTLPTKA